MRIPHAAVSGAFRARIGVRRRSTRWLGLLAGVLSAGFTVHLAVLHGSSTRMLTLGDLALTGAAAWSAASCLRQARASVPTAPRAWLLLGYSQAANACGAAVWTWADLYRGGQTTASLLVCVVLLLLALSLAVTALVVLVAPAPSELSWLCRMLDAWVVVGSVLALVWTLTVWHIGHPPLLDDLGRAALGVARPALNLLALAVFLGVRLSTLRRNGARLVNFALVLVAVAAVLDTGFDLGDPPPYHAGPALRLVWTAGCLALGFVDVIERRAGVPRAASGLTTGRLPGRISWTRPGTARPPAESDVAPGERQTGVHRAVCAVLTPYLAAAVCAATLVFRVTGGRSPDVTTLLCCSGVLLALLARQGVTLLQNIALTRELSDQESHFRSLVQGSSDVIMIAGADGRLTYVSPAAQGVYGRSAETLVGGRLRDLIHPEDRGHVLSTVRRFLAEGPRRNPVTRVECRIRSGDGQWLHVESTVNRYQDGLIFNSRDVTDRVRLQAQLQYHAFHDPLTDLPNRTLFTERTRQALSARRAGDRAVAVLYLDLDGFKAVNDAAGHDVGDELLSQVARRLEASVRSGDTVARLGGDEFAALIRGEAEQQALVEIAERLLEQLSRSYPVGGVEARVAASIGIAFAEDGVDSGELLRNADLAMYRAKARGKGCVEVYAPRMRADVHRRTVLDRRLRTAMRDGDFTLLHQPVVDLADGTVRGLRAHIRWRSRLGTLLTPAEFLRAPEATERRKELAVWAVAQVAREQGLRGAAEPRAAAPPVTVALPASLVTEADVVARLAAAVHGSGVSPRHLVLEFTDTHLVTDPGTVAGPLCELRDLGVGIALGGLGGDFLRALYSWPLGYLRLDDELVRRLDGPACDGSDARGRGTAGYGAGASGEGSRLVALTSGVLRIARDLGLCTVADGVNRTEQALVLRRFGCQWAQGPLFGGPMGERQLRDVLAVGRVAVPSTVPVGARQGGPPPGREVSAVPPPRRPDCRETAESGDLLPHAADVPSPAGVSGASSGPLVPEPFTSRVPEPSTSCPYSETFIPRT